MIFGIVLICMSPLAWWAGIADIKVHATLIILGVMWVSLFIDMPRIQKRREPYETRVVRTPHELSAMANDMCSCSWGKVTYIVDCDITAWDAMDQMDARWVQQRLDDDFFNQYIKVARL